MTPFRLFQRGGDRDGRSDECRSEPCSEYRNGRGWRSNRRDFTKRLREAMERWGEGSLGTVALPTLGGKQLWFDRLVFAGWRIQENVITGHCRLLDVRDVRRAWGSFTHCLTRFQWFRQHRGLGHAQDHIVIMVHGLLRAHGMFARLETWLSGQGVEALAFNYASARRGLADHARALADALEHLDGVTTVTFVTYSLGALVVRRLLADCGVSRDSSWQKRITVSGVFMIGPPNGGARMAEVMLKGGVMGWLAAPVARDLMPGQAVGLPLPEVRYAIVAGGTGRAVGFNPLLAGDNDGFVTVAETRLTPGDDVLLVRAPHGLLVNHKRTQNALARFLAGQKIATEVRGDRR